MQNIKSKQKYTKSGLLRYFLKGSVFLFVVCIAASLILTFLNTVIPKIISFTIDSVLDSEPVPTVYAPIVTALGGIDSRRYYSGHCARDARVSLLRNVL